MNKIRTAESPREVFSIIQACAGDFDEIHSATCLYQIAKLRRKLTPEDARSEVLRDLVDYLEYQTTRMIPYTLANTAWSVKELRPAVGDHVLKLMPSIAQQTILTVSQFSPRHLSNVASASAGVKYSHEALFETIAGAALGHIQEWDARYLSNLAWSFATLRIHHAALMDAIADQAVSKIRTFYAQSLTNLAWAFATLGIEHMALMNAIAEEAVLKIYTFKAMELANLAWAFASLGFSHTALMEAIADNGILAVERMKLQELSNVAWSYKRLDIHAQRLLTAVCSALSEQSVGVPASETLLRAWTTILPAAVGMGALDTKVLKVFAGLALRPGVLRKANAFKVSTFMRCAQLDGWEAKEPELHRALAQEVELRSITPQAIESELLDDPAKWIAKFA